MELKQTKLPSRKQTFSSKYSAEFPFITSSSVSPNHAFCKPCRSNINIAHGGRSDIVRHAKTTSHTNAVKLDTDGKQQTLAMFKTKPVNDDSTSLIRAECLFTKFYIEHNIPFSAADHMGKLLRSAFPNSEEVKKFSSGRTKTTCLAKEMATFEVEKLGKIIRNKPYSVATDGSHTSDSKLYPLIIMYADDVSKEIRHQLLSLPALESASTGVNIGQLIITELTNKGIPLDHCISMGSDNAPVMLGRKTGVIAQLNEVNRGIIALGCPCHLINIAAQNAAKAIPVSIDNLLIDIYYYLEASVNRKLKLNEFQDLCGLDMQKMLRHVCTRWLSLGTCVERLNKQWPALNLFFDSEIYPSTMTNKSVPQMPPLMKSFTIPKLSTSTAPNSASNSTNCRSKKRKHADSIENSTSKGAKTTKLDNYTSEPRVNRIQACLKSNLTKAFSFFLQFSISFFEKANVALQTRIPLIFKLRALLNEFLKNLMSCFVKPSAFNGKEVRYVDYKDKKNQKDDVDICVGNSTLDILESSVEGEDLITFYSSVREYYVRACNYIISNFPLEHEVLKHAEVGDVSKRASATFSSIRFFIKKFKVLVLVEDGESCDRAIDMLECEFNSYCVEDFPPDFLLQTSVEQWFSMANFVDSLGKKKFRKLSYFMLGLLTIPHSNCECERIFSQVRKNKTDFRGSLSTDMLSGLLIVKSNGTPCYDSEFSQEFLKRAKAATKEAVKPQTQ